MEKPKQDPVSVLAYGAQVRLLLFALIVVTFKEMEDASYSRYDILFQSQKILAVDVALFLRTV